MPDIKANDSHAAFSPVRYIGSALYGMRGFARGSGFSFSYEIPAVMFSGMD